MKVIQHRSEKLITDAKEVLAEAAEMNFEAVVIVGWKDGVLHIKNSNVPDRLKVIGAMEEVKYHLITNTGA